jgi:acetyl esterase/lipase
VAGNSVGGNMAAVVALMAKEQKTPCASSCMLMGQQRAVRYGSYQQFAEGHFLTKGMMQWFWDNYTTNRPNAQIHASPLKASAEQLKACRPPCRPPNSTCCVTKAKAMPVTSTRRVPVTSVRYNGMIHDFGLLNPLSQIPKSRPRCVRQHWSSHT